MVTMRTPNAVQQPKDNSRSGQLVFHASNTHGIPFHPVPVFFLFMQISPVPSSREVFLMHSNNAEPVLVISIVAVHYGNRLRHLPPFSPSLKV